MLLHEKKTFVIVTFDFLLNCHSLSLKIKMGKRGKRKSLSFEAKIKIIESATKRFKFEPWCMKKIYANGSARD
jgi:hypothetical protein